MSLLLDSIKESELRNTLSALIVKLQELEKAQERLNKKFDEANKREYTEANFEVHERNDF
jgi:hypothetical protein